MNLGDIKIDDRIIPVGWASMIKDVFWIKIPEMSLIEVVTLFINGISKLEYKNNDYSEYRKMTLIKEESSGGVIVALRKEPVNDE